MTRLLSQSEIDNILDFIKPRKGIPVDSAQIIVKNTKEVFEKQLKNQKVYPEIIPKIKEQLEKIYFKSLITPGESVGVICAQSIGERNTQTTLNSVDYYDKILYMKNNNVFTQNIGEFIDTLLENNKENIVKYQENNTDYLEIEDGYYIPSGDENGIIYWKPIKAITKHLPAGKLVKVTTRSGRIVSASQSKSFLVWDGNKFVDTLGSEIKIGDILPTTKKLNRFGEVKEHFENFKLDEDFGFFIGLYMLDGIIDNYNNINIYFQNVYFREKIERFCKNNNILISFIDSRTKLNSKVLCEFLEKYCKNNLNYKQIPLFCYTSPTEFIKGFIDGYYSIGSFIDNNEITVYPSFNTYGLSFLLSYFGILTKIYDDYNQLTISGKYIELFVKTFNITDKIRKTKLEAIHYSEEILNYPDDRDVYFDEIQSIEYVEATNGFVYDLTVPDTFNFNLFNGLVVRDKLCP
jgi:DNA-directed RNA polymerase subunit A"